MGAYEWLAEASLWWWPRFADHLWQTTLFTLVVLLASFALRRGPAQSRHNFWLLASAKFVIPAAFLVFFAQQAGIDSLPFFSSVSDEAQNALAVSDVTEPASALAFNYEVTVLENTQNDHRKIYLVLTTLWLAGCGTLLSVWGVRRRRFVHSLKLSSTLRAGREWRILAQARETLGLKQEVGLVISPLKIEPAVWRVWRPVVVMPESIANQLDDQELEAILLHELVHIQRRDNLTANLQLALCALLWFHPLVWFISRKLFDEREQACDERVMEVCWAPDAYASSILKVVRFCFGWRVMGVAGAASGSNLRRRIENIMTLGNSKRSAGTASRLLATGLVAIALVVLVCAGVYSDAHGVDAKSTGVEAASFETTSVSAADDGSNIPIDAAGSASQKRRSVPPPPPPEPLQPPQPGQPRQPAQVPQPDQVPQPAQAPRPEKRPQPAHMPPPPEPLQPAQTLQPRQMPAPSKAPRPPRPAAFGIRTSNGGIGGGVRATPASAPSRMRTSPLPASAPTMPPPPPPKQDQKRKDRVEKGRLIEAPNPVYPAQAREDEIQGTVVVRITIDEEGNVISARPKSGPEALRQASLDAAYKARFEPAMKDGKPVQVEAALAYNFVMTRH